MQIIVKALNGISHTIDCEPSSTVYHVKEEVSRESNIPPAQQKLIFGGSELLDHRTLSEYSIPNNSTVYMVIRMNDAQKTSDEEKASSSVAAPSISSEEPKKAVSKAVSKSKMKKKAIMKNDEDEEEDIQDASVQGRLVDGDKAATTIQKIARGRAAQKKAAATKASHLNEAEPIPEKSKKLREAEPIPKKPPVATPPVSSESAAIQAALQQGGKEWGRSRIMIVGEGRAGKTALCNSLIGKPYQATESTVGINQLICDVHYASGGKGGWNPYQKPEKELEAAIASMVAEQKKAASEPTLSASQAKNKPTTSSDDSVISTIAQSTTKKKGNSDMATVVHAKPTPAPAAVAAPAPEVNEELVMKCLANSVNTKSDLIVSVFDYGGQSVFNVIHHLFLTQNGVYVLAFNMEWLLSDGEEKEQCLSYMQFWTNSIYVHTYNSTTNTAAPIVLVGTRKDRITSPRDHERISTILYETFSHSKIWPSILENTLAEGINGTITMWFYPVDNTRARDDVTVQQLMNSIEAAMNANAYTRKKIPLSWLRAVDEMQACRKSCLSLEKVYDIAANKCGVSQEHVPYLLHFLHEMGIALWHDEPGLRDVVILDAVAYFVTPATRVICKHIPDASDGICHVMDVHRECNRQYFNEWHQLTDKGVLDDVLLNVLWKEFGDDRDTLVKLMIKFGLLVPLSAGRGSGSKKYIVPALLPRVDPTTPDMREWTNEPYQTCLFVFTASTELGENSVLLQDDIRKEGFLPAGLFERIIGKAIAWCLATTKAGKFNVRNVTLHKELAILSFGSQRFRLTHCPKINSVRVDIEGKNPLVVQGRLYDLMRDVMNECMRSLECFPALLYSASSGGQMVSGSVVQDVDILSFCFERNDVTMLLPLESIRSAAESQSVLMRPGGRKLMTDVETKKLYEPWLHVYGRRDHYDVFISYRWGEFDGNFVSALFDMFSNFTFGQENRSVEVFLDKKRLQEGRKFDADFAVALARSVVVVPIVSNDSLQRLLHHDPNTVDNMLLEWIMSLSCYSDPACVTKAVFPFAFGARRYSESSEVLVESIFDGDLLNSLPRIVPTATLERATKFLKENNVAIVDAAAFNAFTVHGVVNELMKFMCFQSWTFEPSSVVENGADKVLDVLRACQPEPKVTTAQGDENPCDAIWSMLHDEKFVPDLSAMQAKLDEIGIMSAADIMELDNELSDQIGELLKPIQCKKFKRMTASLLKAT